MERAASNITPYWTRLGKSVSQWSAVLVLDFGGGQGLRKSLFFAEVARLVPECGSGNAGAAVAADQTLVRVLALHLIDEEILERDDVAFHAQDLRDLSDLSRAV